MQVIKDRNLRLFGDVVLLAPIDGFLIWSLEPNGNITISCFIVLENSSLACGTISNQAIELVRV
jgi:hypothetical protein